MERVGLLINKLKEQLEGHASAGSMQVTAQMLLAELQQQAAGAPQKNKVSVILPTVVPVAIQDTTPVEEPETVLPVTAPVIEEQSVPVAAIPPAEETPAPQPFILRPPVQPQVMVEETAKPAVDEPQPAFVWEIKEEEASQPEVAAEPEIPVAAVVTTTLPEPVPTSEPVVAVEPALPVEPPVVEAQLPLVEEPAPAAIPQPQTKPTPIAPWFTEAAASVPTLAQHETKVVYELHETIATETEENTINQRLKEHKTEVASVLQGSPVRDLKKAIGINDRYAFINELFRGDENMYERSIKTINAFNIYPEAEYWIQRELKIKIGWNEDSEIVKQFDQLVKRRFS